MAPVAETRRDETRERSALGRPDISDPDFTQTSEHRTSPREKAHHLMPYGNYLLTSSTTAALRTAHWHRHWRAPSTTLHHREPSRLLCYGLSPMQVRYLLDAGGAGRQPTPLCAWATATATATIAPTTTTAASVLFVDQDLRDS